MTSAEKHFWVNYDAAMVEIRRLEDQSLRQFVMRAVTAAIGRVSAGEMPDAPFDMLFFARTMMALFEQRQNLMRVLSGEDLRWWPDDDE